MRTIVRSTAQTLVALALALMLPNTASAACEGFADVRGMPACYPCGASAPAAGQTQARQPSYISMAQAQTAALDAANIDAASADISSSTLDEVAGRILLQGGIHGGRPRLRLLHQRRDRRGAGDERP